MTKNPVRGLLALLLLVSPLGCEKEHAADPEPSHPPGEIWLSPERMTQAGIVLQKAQEQWVGDAIVTSGRVTFDDTRVAHIFSPVNDGGILTTDGP